MWRSAIEVVLEELGCVHTRLVDAGSVALGQLQLAAGAIEALLEGIEHRTRHDVAAEDAELRVDLAGWWFLDEVLDAKHPALGLADRDAEARGL